MDLSRLVAGVRNAAVAVLACAGILGSAHAAVVNVSASQASVQVGGSFALYFDIRGLSTSALGGFDLDLDFDDTVLAFTGHSFTDTGSGRNELDLNEPGSPFAFFGDVLQAGGVIDAFAASGNSQGKLESDQADDFRFLTLTFTALAPSAGSTLGIDLLDAGLVFSDAAAGLLAYSFDHSAATVVIAGGTGGTVPEPGALALVLLALAGAALAPAARRRARGRGLPAPRATPDRAAAT